MGTFRRQVLLNALKLFDLAVMTSCFLLASVYSFHDSAVPTFSEFLSMRIKVSNFVLFFALLWMWHLICAAFGLYSSRRLSSPRALALDVVKAVAVGTLLLLVATVTFHIRLVTRDFVVAFWLTTTIATALARLALRGALEQIRLRGRNLRHMLIVGANARAVQVAQRISLKPELGYRILGFVDQGWEGSDEFRQSGYSVVSDIDHLAQYLRDSIVDEVVIALPLKSQHGLAALVARVCEEQGIITRVLSDLFDLKLARARVEELEGASLITHYTGNDEGWPVVTKRVLDITVSASLLALLAPLLLVVAALIKLTSAGPVLFCQSRLGFNKRRFKICKFRTMVADAEQQIKTVEHLNEVSGPVFKMKNDPRMTTIGRFLRKTSIDELPQLWNVLRGDMSLVGPRPLPVRDYEGFNEDWQRRRFSVRPGITCLWQIAGRSSIPFEKWMQLDLQYIDQWSLRLDLEILLRTIPAVLRGSGAA
jgi:exopolysaccharide biosynthesis polyprenyl glycosylphosphotransferase